MSKKVPKMSQKKCQKSGKKSAKKSTKKVSKKVTKKGPKNVSIFETFLVPKTRQKGYTLLTRFDVGVITTNIVLYLVLGGEHPTHTPQLKKESKNRQPKRGAKITSENNLGGRTLHSGTLADSRGGTKH